MTSLLKIPCVVIAVLGLVGCASTAPRGAAPQPRHVERSIESDDVEFYGNIDPNEDVSGLDEDLDTLSPLTIPTPVKAAKITKSTRSAKAMKVGKAKAKAPVKVRQVAAKRARS